MSSPHGQFLDLFVEEVRVWLAWKSIALDSLKLGPGDFLVSSHGQFQTIRPYSHLSRAAVVMGRIPVSRVTWVGDEISGDDQNAEKSKSGMPRRDMTTGDEMTFKAHSETFSQNPESNLGPVRPLSHTHESACEDACVHEKSAHAARSVRCSDAKLRGKKEKLDDGT